RQAHRRLGELDIADVVARSAVAPPRRDDLRAFLARRDRGRTFLMLFRLALEHDGPAKLLLVVLDHLAGDFAARQLLVIHLVDDSCPILRFAAAVAVVADLDRRLAERLAAEVVGVGWLERAGHEALLPALRRDDSVRRAVLAEVIADLGDLEHDLAFE